jgi:2-dehydropantoate 2-reductase
VRRDGEQEGGVMRIAVIAAGAVGGYFGGRLAQGGHEVAFVAHSRQLEALRACGLRVESPLGDMHLPDVEVTDDPAEIGPVDLGLFSVKLWDTLEAAEASKPLLGGNTAVASFQIFDILSIYSAGRPNTRRLPRT